MENQRSFLFIALLAVSAVLYTKWLEFSNPVNTDTAAISSTANTASLNNAGSALPSAPTQASADLSTLPATPNTQPQVVPTDLPVSNEQDLITVTTDLIVVKINTRGGVIERVELRDEPVSIDKPETGYPLLKRTDREIFVAEDGLLASEHGAPNHIDTQYQSTKRNYDLGSAEKVTVPLVWTSADGIEYVKNIQFTRDSYIVDISYQVTNKSAKVWNGYSYAQFSRLEQLANRLLSSSS